MYSRIADALRLSLFSKKWRRLNQHNETYPTNRFDVSKVTVGMRTYGLLTVDMFDAADERLIIGNYVSIANRVRFVLGGGHRVNALSTYPFKVKMLGGPSDAISKGPLIIEDDVWIGTDVLILSGVRAGKGAIIAAGSVVTKNIEPYAIYGGNPARLIRYRVEPDLIPDLMAIDLSKLSYEVVANNIDVLCEPLQRETLNRIMALLQ